MKKTKVNNGINTLALFGGNPVHEKEWPSWPRAGMAAQRALLNVLHSDRWTVSARSRKETYYEKTFSEEFAHYIGKKHGVSCSSGSAALKIALQAIDLKNNDEVIVPNLTWVAVGSVVAHLGGIPVCSDIENDSLAMSVEFTRSLITPKTKAIIVAHMYSSRVHMKLFRELCDEHKISLIEDGSQAHGARLEGGKIGSFGDISIFSMQQTKLLTGGEGGIALTDSYDLYMKMQQLRTDGRIYGGKDSSGFYQLKSLDTVLGSNLCMSEFHAVILIEGLNRLDRENQHRRHSVKVLRELISEFEGFSILDDILEPSNGKTYYKLALTFSEEIFEKIPAPLMAEILSCELNLPVETLDTPLSYRKELTTYIKRKISSMPQDDFSKTNKVIKHTITLPHYCLLGVDKDLHAITKALRKVLSCAKYLRNEVVNGIS